MKESTFFNLYSSFKDSIRTGAMVSLGNSIELPVLTKRLGHRIICAVFPELTKLTSRLAQLSQFTQHLLRMNKHHGGVFVVKYLKASQLAISKAIAGVPFKSLRELEPELQLPRLTSSGLPGFIPLRDRRAILTGSPSVIRWWMTLYGIYRILSVPGKLKMSTITDLYKGSPIFLNIASTKLELLSSSFKKGYSWKPVDPRGGMLWLESSSPNFVVSWLGLVHDLDCLRSANLLGPLFSLIDEFWGQDSQMRAMAEKILALCDLRRIESKGVNSGAPLKDMGDTKYYLGQWEGCTTDLLREEVPKGRIGQLSFKEEAAGKVRVFAMVDIWTQSILKPLHDAISDILRSLPNDGTFDQQAAVKRCFEKSKTAGFSYGYDLSAATDRLPISLQMSVVKALFGQNVGSSWRDLLIERDYWYSRKIAKDQYDTGSVRYAVGQPMGALSSFNMLALTHHMIVQSCAFDAGLVKRGIWWDNYELLGDDIVIFDHSVSRLYLEFMSKLGMEVNVKKSVVAVNNTFEFAKVTGHNGRDVSALSWKMFIANNSFMGRANTAFFLLKKGIGRPGQRWLWNILRHKKYTPGQLNTALCAVFSMFGGSGMVSLNTMLQALISMSGPLSNAFIQVTEALRTDYIRMIMSAVLAGNEPSVDKGPLITKSWSMMWPFLKAHKLKVIRAGWEKYFKDSKTTELHLCKLTDRILQLVADGSTAPADAPKEINEVSDLLDSLWWDIYDNLHYPIYHARKKLDHVGLEAIDIITLEELEEASKVPGSVESVLSLPDRAIAKLEDAEQSEVDLSSLAVDSISWIAAARKSQLKKVPMDWQSESWDVWYY